MAGQHHHPSQSCQTKVDHFLLRRFKEAVKKVKASYLELILAGLLELFVSAMCCSLVYHVVARE